jgi:hypothetical protein
LIILKSIMISLSLSALSFFKALGGGGGEDTRKTSWIS